MDVPSHSRGVVGKEVEGLWRGGGERRGVDGDEE
jgi:hypothetical protein